MQNKFLQNNPRGAYRKLNFLRKGIKSSNSICKKTDGTITAEEEEVKKKWREFFKELFDNPTQGKGQEIKTTQEDQKELENDPPTIEEIDKVVKSIKKQQGSR